MMRALILKPGPRWEDSPFDDVEKGDIVIVTDPDGKPSHENPVIAESNAEEEPPPAYGVFKATNLPFSQSTIACLWGPAQRAGISFPAFVEGIRAMAKVEEGFGASTSNAT